MHNAEVINSQKRNHLEHVPSNRASKCMLHPCIFIEMKRKINESNIRTIELIKCVKKIIRLAYRLESG